MVTSVVEQASQRDPFAELSRFRADFYDCLRGRGDALFELADALLCTEGPVKTLVDLALAPEHRRGHGALYGALNKGRLDIDRLRTELASLSLPRAADGRLVLAVDVSPWLRPDAGTCPDRSFCHTYGRGDAKHQMIPGWPYSFVVALEAGRTSWTAGRCRPRPSPRSAPAGPRPSAARPPRAGRRRTPAPRTPASGT
ncbi:transposase [Kitasatospora cathayae]|uniref:Transposase n=1 Tax=Kitasatospora cathayae TaxID=3004092 RepID=A0ABY7QGN3_9ACTN|nr:transposase [Kitasatospora sp. HUAS 3-15]WBP91311.1 transposase [Kitasatospora sp. HUAS 3-15]